MGYQPAGSKTTTRRSENSPWPILEPGHETHGAGASQNMPSHDVAIGFGELIGDPWGPYVWTNLLAGKKNFRAA